MQIYHNTLTPTTVSIQSEEYGMRAYVNSAKGRVQLEAECPVDLVKTIEDVWGGAPTVAEPEYQVPTLEEAKQSKLAELSTACQNAIYTGIDVTDTKGTEHFSLTMADQTNLSTLAEAVTQGAASVPYHADGQLCRMFSADEIKTIFKAAKAHVTQNVTLCNHLNVWVRRCAVVADIQTITYTSTLPDDLLANYKSVLSAAGGTT